MKQNMGAIDRIIRLILAAVIAALYFTCTISGIVAIILVIIGIIFVLTSLIGFCPAYALFNISTKPKKKKKKR